MNDLFEQAPSAIVIFKGPDAIIELANKRAIEIIGRSKEELIGRKLEDAMPELRNQGYIELIKQVYRSGEQFVSEESPVTFVNNNKRVDAFIKYIFQPLKNEQGEINGVMAIGDDVSAQVIARRKTQESENRFKNVLLQSPSIFCILEGEEMVIRFANKPLLESWGRSWDIVGKPLLEVLPELKDQEFPKLLKTVYSTGKHHMGNAEKATIIKDGRSTDIYYNYVYQPIFEADGKISGITVMANDITEEVIARKLIEQSEKRLQHFIKQAPVGIAVYRGKDFVVEAANEMVLEMWGKTIDEVQGKPMEVIFPEIHSLESVKVRHQASVERFLKGETHVVTEEQLTFKRNGELFTGWYNYTHQPIFDEQGNPSGVIAVATDVTEQVLSRKKIEDSERELQTLLKQAPVFFMLFEGEDLVVKVANNTALQLIGKKEEEVLNKSIDEYSPELAERKKIYLDVYHTEKPFSAKEVEINFMRDGKMHNGYYNLNYMPWYSVDGKVKGVMATGIEVTEQVVARRKIEESEKELESLANAMPQLVWIAEPNGEVIFYNERINEFSGVKKLSDGKWQWDGLLHKDDLDYTLQAWNKALAEKGTYEVEHRIMMKDATYRWHLSRAFPIKDANNNTVKWYGTATDIHQIKSAEERVRESELTLRQTKEQLELSINAGKIGVWHWDVKKNEMTWSSEQLEIFGVSKEDFKGGAEDFFKYIVEEDKERIKAISKLEFERSANQYEFRIRRKDGEIRWIQSRSKTFMDEQGRPQYITGVNIDITEQVLTRKRVEESEESYRNLINNLSVAVYTCDKEGNIILYNEKAEELWGRKPIRGKDKWIGWDKIELEGQMLDPEKSPMAMAVQQGKPIRVREVQVQKPDGSMHTVIPHPRPLFNTSGEVVGGVNILVDITERKKIEQALQESEGRFRTMANAAPLFVWETDETLQTTYLNKEGLRYFDLDETFSMAELSWKKFIHPDDIDKVLNTMWDAVERSQSYTIEMRLKNGKTGEYHWFLDKGAPRYHNEKFIGFIGTSLDIHERKEVEKELEEKVAERTSELAGQNILLQKQNDLVKKIFDASVDAIGVYDTDMRIITLNQSAVNIFGLKFDELIGKNLLEIVPTMKGSKGHMDLQQAIAGETIHNKVYQSGVTNRYYENFLLPLKDEKDNVYAVLVIAHDNTDLIEAAKKLSDAQQIAQVGSWEWDIVTNELTWSENMYNIYGLNSEDGISYEKFVSLVHPDDVEIAQATIASALASKTFNDFFHRIITPAGEEKIMHARGEVIADKEGKIVRMVGTGQDVTKQKITEQQLIATSKNIEERNQFIEQLINSSLDLITVIDKDLRLITLNRKAQNIYGEFYKEDFIGRKITEINPPLKGTESLADIREAFTGKVIIKDKVKSTISDRYFEHNYIPLTNATGEVYAVMIISHEITESMRQMEELRKLYESDEQKNNFIAMASHELKTPITSIKGYVQLLLNAIEKEKDHQKALPPLLVRSSLLSVDKQIKRLTRLISELLDISKIETGTLELKKEIFSLNELAIETVEDILYTNTKHQINLYHDHHNVVLGDKDRIGQVMINFLTNAIKYSPDSDRIDVTIHKTGENEIAFSVKDQGIGIDKDEQKKVFDRFYRAKGKEEQTYPGFGIGLFIAKEFVQKHGGRIMVSSEKGKGSVFTFTLPVYLD